MASKFHLGLGIVLLIAFGVSFLYLIFVGIGPHYVGECHVDWKAYKVVCSGGTLEGFELYKSNLSLIIASLIGLIVGDLFVLFYVVPVRHYTINRPAFWSIFGLLVGFLLVVLGFLVIYLIVVFNTPYIGT
jgi:hypothetical protein